MSGFDFSHVTVALLGLVSCPNLKLNMTGASFKNLSNSLVSGVLSGITSPEINLSDADFTNTITTGVTDMSSMFADCSSLTSLNLSSFDTSSVTNMSAMFAATSNLASITVGK